MDSHRVEKKAMRQIILEDEDAEIDLVSGVGAAGMGEVEIDRLSEIIKPGLQAAARERGCLRWRMREVT